MRFNEGLGAVGRDSICKPTDLAPWESVFSEKFLNADRFIKVFCLLLTELGEIPKFWEGGKGEEGIIGELGN